jgi:hypothetical protein
MFEAPPEVRMTAGYLLALGAGIVLYMRFAFTRAATDVSVRSSVARILYCVIWGASIIAYVRWPDLLERWNLFIFPQVRWSSMVPATLSILLMIWAMRSHLQLDEDGNIDASGLYTWCRYPLDAALTLFVIAVTLLCANWLLLAVTLVSFSLHRFGVPFELERVRRERLGPAYDEYAARTGWFLPSVAPAKKAHYQVPSRFGLTAIMGLLTVLAIIFGLLRAFDAPPVVYLFVGSEIMAICLAQILFGAAPRGSSALTGAILLPLWVFLTMNTRAVPMPFHLILTLFLIAFGGLMGYCIGALAAGFFLMMDLIEPWLIRDAAVYQLPIHEFPEPKGPSDSD